MKKKSLFILILPILTMFSIGAQTTMQKGMGVILFAEGDELSIYRANALQTYAASSTSLLGMVVEAGDLIQTGPSTFVEIQLLPSQSVIKVAENTSFRMTGINTANGSTIDVIYGRIRAKVDSALGTGGFAVRGKTSIAAVRGTEFGYDVVAVPGVGSEPSSQIYSFDGTVSVFPLQPDDLAAGAAGDVFDESTFKDRKAYDVNAGQMVVVYDTPDAGAKSALDKLAGKESVNAEGSRSVVATTTIKQSIKNYWKNHADQGKVLSEEEVQVQYYGLKTAKNNDSSKSATLPQPAASPEPVNNQVSAAAPGNIRSSLADEIAPISSIKAIDSLSPNQYVLVEEQAKLAGIILSTIGLVGNLTGAAFYNFGTDFGMTQSAAQTTGVVTFSVSGVLMVSGLLSYVIGLFR